MITIVVYGTLRKGHYNQKLYLPDFQASYQKDAYLSGTLYTLKDKPFPAFLPQGNHLVKAEIHVVDDKALAAMDEMEQYYGPNHPDNYYERSEVAIYDENHQLIQHGQCYIYNLNRQNAKDELDQIIESHDFSEYVKQYGEK